MFDIGFSEIFIVAVVALLVLGPERLPRAARFTGLWVRRARAQWYSVKAELENELVDDELKRSLLRTQEELREIRAEIHNHGRELQNDLRQEGDAIDQTIKAPDTPSAIAALESSPGFNGDTATADDGMTGVFDPGPLPAEAAVAGAKNDGAMAAASIAAPPSVADGKESDPAARTPGTAP